MPQRQRPDGSPAQPQGQGFIAAISWKRAGNSHCRAAREIVTRPDSSGSRRTSSALRDHSGNSSRNSTPWCASEISPGRGTEPPPASATALAVWCGLRNGRDPQRRASAPRPPTEAMAATCRRSSSTSAGSTPGRREASRVLPQPGGPTSNRWCSPAAAISSARRACAWPQTSARSGTGSGGHDSASACGSSTRPDSAAHTCSRVRALRTSLFAASAASPPLANGTTIRLPSRAAASAAGKLPSIARTSPVRPSSPRNSQSRSASSGTWPLAASTPSAIGRS